MPDQKLQRRLDFAMRLLEICNDMELPERGRQTQLGKQFEVTQQAAKRWLDGKSWPETDTIEAIATWADVNVNWLWQGVGPKRGNRIDTKALVIDEAIRRLPREQGIDLIDIIRAKLIRIGKMDATDQSQRYLKMLDAYEHDLQQKRH